MWDVCAGGRVENNAFGGENITHGVDEQAYYEVEEGVYMHEEEPQPGHMHDSDHFSVPLGAEEQGMSHIFHHSLHRTIFYCWEEWTPKTNIATVLIFLE